MNSIGEGIFKSSHFLFSKVRRDLSSFDSANLIDEGEFPQYVMDVLKTLGISVLKEEEAVIAIKDYSGRLPDNFSALQAAYRCTPSYSHKNIAHQQGPATHVYHDVTWELLEKGKDCEIDCCRDNTQILEHIEVRQYVQGLESYMNFTSPILLSLSPNVRKDKCASDCENLYCRSQHEIDISDKKIYTNFPSDSVYIKYYGIPYDQDGLPMIPDLELVERTIEWYIKYQFLMNLWMNNQVPDLQNRWQYAEQQYTKFLGAAKHERKFPSFANVVNQIRAKRKSNNVLYFASQDRSGNWTVR